MLGCSGQSSAHPGPRPRAPPGGTGDAAPPVLRRAGRPTPQRQACRPSSRSSEALPPPSPAGPPAAPDRRRPRPRTHRSSRPDRRGVGGQRRLSRSPSAPTLAPLAHAGQPAPAPAHPWSPWDDHHPDLRGAPARFRPARKVVYPLWVGRGSSGNAGVACRESSGKHPVTWNGRPSPRERISFVRNPSTARDRPARLTVLSARPGRDLPLAASLQLLAGHRPVRPASPTPPAAAAGPPTCPWRSR
ncbi:hypothetical protein SBADM41S_01782 [Streptomyces badius]